jgi:hypothetical protein
MLHMGYIRKLYLEHPVKSILSPSSVETDDGNHRFTAEAKKTLNHRSQSVE